MEIDDQIAKNIGKYFEDHNLSPTSVAENIEGLGRSVIRDIIKRNSRSPTYSTLFKISSHLELSVIELISYPDKIDPSSQDAEILDLWYQLDPVERQFLLSTGKTQLSSRPFSDEQSDED